MLGNSIFPIPIDIRNRMKHVSAEMAKALCHIADKSTSVVFKGTVIRFSHDLLVIRSSSIMMCFPFAC